MSVDLALRPSLTAAWLSPQSPPAKPTPAVTPEGPTGLRRVMGQRLAALLDEGDALLCRFEVDDAFERDLPLRRR